MYTFQNVSTIRASDASRKTEDSSSIDPLCTLRSLGYTTYSLPYQDNEGKNHMYFFMCRPSLIRYKDCERRVRQSQTKKAPSVKSKPKRNQIDWDVLPPVNMRPSSGFATTNSANSSLTTETNSVKPKPVKLNPVEPTFLGYTRVQLIEIIKSNPIWAPGFQASTDAPCSGVIDFGSSRINCLTNLEDSFSLAFQLGIFLHGDGSTVHSYTWKEGFHSYTWKKGFVISCASLPGGKGRKQCGASSNGKNQNAHKTQTPKKQTKQHPERRSRNPSQTPASKKIPVAKTTMDKRGMAITRPASKQRDGTRTINEPVQQTNLASDAKLAKTEYIDEVRGGEAGSLVLVVDRTFDQLAFYLASNEIPDMTTTMINHMNYTNVSIKFDFHLLNDFIGELVMTSVDNIKKLPQDNIDAWVAERLAAQNGETVVIDLERVKNRRFSISMPLLGGIKDFQEKIGQIYMYCKTATYIKQVAVTGMSPASSSSLTVHTGPLAKMNVTYHYNEVWRTPAKKHLSYDIQEYEVSWDDMPVATGTITGRTFESTPVFGLGEATSNVSSVRLVIPNAIPDSEEVDKSAVVDLIITVASKFSDGLSENTKNILNVIADVAGVVLPGVVTTVVDVAASVINWVIAEDTSNEVVGTTGVSKNQQNDGTTLIAEAVGISTNSSSSQGFNALTKTQVYQQISNALSINPNLVHWAGVLNNLQQDYGFYPRVAAQSPVTGPDATYVMDMSVPVSGDGQVYNIATKELTPLLSSGSTRDINSHEFATEYPIVPKPSFRIGAIYNSANSMTLGCFSLPHDSPPLFYPFDFSGFTVSQVSEILGFPDLAFPTHLAAEFVEEVIADGLRKNVTFTFLYRGTPVGHAHEEPCGHFPWGQSTMRLAFYSAYGSVQLINPGTVSINERVRDIHGNNLCTFHRPSGADGATDGIYEIRFHKRAYTEALAPAQYLGPAVSNAVGGFKRCALQRCQHIKDLTECGDIEKNPGPIPVVAAIGVWLLESVGFSFAWDYLRSGDGKPENYADALHYCSEYRHGSIIEFDPSWNNHRIAHSLYRPTERCDSECDLRYRIAADVLIASSDRHLRFLKCLLIVLSGDIEENPGPKNDNKRSNNRKANNSSGASSSGPSRSRKQKSDPLRQAMSAKDAIRLIQDTQYEQPTSKGKAKESKEAKFVEETIASDDIELKVERFLSSPKNMFAALVGIEKKLVKHIMNCSNPFKRDQAVRARRQMISMGLYLDCCGDDKCHGDCQLNQFKPTITSVLLCNTVKSLFEYILPQRRPEVVKAYQEHFNRCHEIESRCIAGINITDLRSFDYIVSRNVLRKCCDLLQLHCCSYSCSGPCQRTQIVEKMVLEQSKLRQAALAQSESEFEMASKISRYNELVSNIDNCEAHYRSFTIDPSHDLANDLTYSSMIHEAKVLSTTIGCICCPNACKVNCIRRESFIKEISAKFSPNKVIVQSSQLHNKSLQLKVQLHGLSSWPILFIVSIPLILTFFFPYLWVYETLLASCAFALTYVLFQTTWYRVNECGQLTSAQEDELMSLSTPQAAPDSNPLGARKEKEKFQMPQLQLVEIQKKSLLSWLVKDYDDVALIDWLEERPAFLPCCFLLAIFSWLGVYVFSALAFITVISSFQISRRSMKLISLEAFTAYTSAEVITHGGTLESFKVECMRLTRTLNNLILPSVLSFMVPNADNVLNMTLDVATLVFHHRKNEEEWCGSYLKVRAPRNNLILWVWLDMVQSFFQPLLHCLVPALNLVALGATPLILLHALTQIVLPTIVTQFICLVLALFSMGLRIRTLISAQLMTRCSELFTDFVAVCRRLTCRCRSASSVDSPVVSVEETSEESTATSCTSMTGCLQPLIQTFRRPSLQTHSYELVPVAIGFNLQNSDLALSKLSLDDSTEEDSSIYSNEVSRETISESEISELIHL